MLRIQATFLTEEYKVSLQACDFNASDYLPISAPTLTECASRCTADYECNSLITRGADCGMMKSCPAGCTSSIPGGGWGVYCPDGKTNYLTKTMHSS